MESPDGTSGGLKTEDEPPRNPETLREPDEGEPILGSPKKNSTNEEGTPRNQGKNREKAVKLPNPEARSMRKNGLGVKRQPDEVETVPEDRRSDLEEWEERVGGSGYTEPPTRCLWIGAWTQP